MSFEPDELMKATDRRYPGDKHQHHNAENAQCGSESPGPYRGMFLPRFRLLRCFSCADFSMEPNAKTVQPEGESNEANARHTKAETINNDDWQDSR